jgi:excinuclease ABC subunit A
MKVKKKRKEEEEVKSPGKNIFIKGARVHNLKNIDVEIPRNKLVVITGLSGSGKSSLAFDTLYAEGQRRYVESLSSYARQFLGRLDKPDVDYIHGISPAIAIEQKVNTSNPRSTVGTGTEIYDYLKLLFARVGKTYSPISGKEVRRHTPSDVSDAVASMPEGTRLALVCPLTPKAGRTPAREISVLLQQGFSRAIIQDETVRLDEIPEKELKKLKAGEVWLLIDRFTADASDETLARVADSASTAFFEGGGSCMLLVYGEGKTPERAMDFSNKFEMDGIVFEEPSVNLFTFNNPYGACKTCEGFGWVLGIDEELVIPDKTLSVYEGAVACWRGDKLSEWRDDFVKKSVLKNFPVHRPYMDLSDAERELLWRGDKDLYGIDDFFRFVEEQTFKIQYRVLLSRYRGRTVCYDCKGTRLRRDANYVKVGGKSITELVLMPVEEALAFFNTLELSEHDAKVGDRLLTEIRQRLGFLCDLGLGYLTLNRRSNSLSGGESQRINLATSLGSSLVGSIYILDEPSIGLHSRDTEKLVHVIKKLRDLGNTVVVVEHDEDIMKHADHIIDMGPGAGRLGGEVVFSGPASEMKNVREGFTGPYLSGKMEIPVPAKRRAWNNYIEITGARENNLKNVSVKIPLGVLTAVTGVSGSGKTSLIKQVFYPALMRHYGGYGEKSGAFEKLKGGLSLLQGVEMVDQDPIGKSSRSNPVTYLKVYDEIRALYSGLPKARQDGLKPAHFSFNVAGGRCDTCEGEGTVTIEMQFMADVTLQCESCKGKRFKEEILAVEYRGKNISEILDLTVEEAIAFFKEGDKAAVKIAEKLQPLSDVGLDYVKLGQSSSTLSGGEAQRVKLAYFLSKGTNEGKKLFIFDEPTTGLHFHDINKLLDSFNALIEKGHSILVIEHNLDVVKCCDWVIDMGPGGGNAGGTIVFEGTPEDLVKAENSHTAKYLRYKVKKL